MIPPSNLKTMIMKNLFHTAAFLLTASSAFSAQVAMRLGQDAPIIDAYQNAPASYPTTKASLDFIHFDGTVTQAKNNLFTTNRSLVEIGMYTAGGSFTGQEVVAKIRGYEAANMTVYGVLLYREDWLPQIGGTGGPIEIDRRILSAAEVQNIRNAINNANPPLQSTNVKLIQLLGGRVAGQTGASWSQMTAARKASLGDLFDGVAIECHVGDEVATTNFPDGPATLAAMAQVTSWAKANSELALVFMGGLPATYENLPATQATFFKLWAHMNNVSVGKNAPHVIYFRQGARPGNHTPESASNTLTHQMRWLINQVQ